jgi:UDP-N-acetylmuramoylalanine--D-glutamate ligase
MIDLSHIKPQLHGKPVAVVGLGKSGMPVFEACRAAGIATVLWDDNEDQRKSAAAKGAIIEDLTQADFSCFALLCLAPGIPLHFPKPHPSVLRARAAGVEVVGDIELFHRARHNVRTIGITGTNGKSTTTALIGHILKEARMPSATGGNIGEAILTLPDLPAAAIYVIEMSSYQIDLCPTFAPEIAALINLAPDHLDRHGGMEGYIAAKEKIFRGRGTAIIGVDDETSRGVYERVKQAGARKVIPVSCLKAFENGVTVTADGVMFDHGAKVIDLKTCPNLKGVHNWQNAAVAYAACHAAGAPQIDVIKGMQSFPGLAHRQNIVATINGVLYVNDSKATNDQAAAMALRTFDPVYWIAGGRPKEGGYKDCEKYLKRVRHAWLIGEAEESMSKWLHHKKVPYTLSGTLDHALQGAHAQAQDEKIPGAAVLLSPACASWDQFKNFEHRGEVFTELVKTLAGQKKKQERA